LPQNWRARALHSKFGQLDQLTPPSQLGFRASNTMESKAAAGHPEVEVARDGEVAVECRG
jgi:hypothetical protein